MPKLKLFSDSKRNPLLPKDDKVPDRHDEKHHQQKENTKSASSLRSVENWSSRAENGSSRRGLMMREHSKPVLNQVFNSSSTLRLDGPALLEKELQKESSGECSIHQPKSLLYTLLNPRSRRWEAQYFKSFITAVIVADLVCFVMSTEPDLSERQQEMFLLFEGVSSSIFLLEYILRLYTVTEGQKYKELGNVRGRLKWALTFGSLIDLAAIAPFFLELLSGGTWNLPTLTFLRCFRLFRILKTNGMIRATDAVCRVIYYNREILIVAVLIMFMLIILTSVLMFYLRPPANYDPSGGEFILSRYSLQKYFGIRPTPSSLSLFVSHFYMILLRINPPTDFSSLASTMYVSTLLLTGQGGPDGTDLPWYTRGVILLTGAFSIGMFAIPASMLTWGFEAEAARIAKRARQKATKHPHHHSHTSSDWSSSDDDYSTDEEYIKIIAGDEGGNGEEDEATKAAMAAFLKADADGSGSMSLQEYLQMTRSAATSQGSEALTQRIDRLEAKVDDLVSTMNKLCELMEKKK